MTMQAISPLNATLPGFVVTVADMYAYDSAEPTGAAVFFAARAGGIEMIDPTVAALRDGKVVQRGAFVVGPASRWIQGEWV